MRDSEYNANEQLAAMRSTNPMFDALDARMDELLRTMPRVSPRTRQDVYDDAYWNVMEGKDCSFYADSEWRTAAHAPEFDNEQYIPLFNAIKVAASLIGASDEDRWCVVANALRAEAEKYAEYEAESARITQD